MANEVSHGRAHARAARLTNVIGSPARAATLIVGGLMLLAIFARILLDHRIPAPWIMGDELLYSELAKSFSEHHQMLFRGQDWPFLSIYPMVVSPAWLAGSMDTTYGLVKAMNAVLMSLVAVPMFIWARRLVSPLYAAAAAALVLLMPVFVYTNEVMTENLAFPVVMFAFLAIAGALERPTAVRQVLALAAIGLACATRLQALILLVVLPTAIAAKVFLDARAEPPPSLRRFLVKGAARYALTFGLLVFGALAYVGLKVAEGQPLSSLLGQYQGVESGNYPLSAIARWVALHAAELSYSVGLLPVSAFLILLGLALRRGAPTRPAERALLAVTVASTVWILLQVGAYASRYSLRIEERNMFYLAPLFFLALVVWVDRGLPRPAPLAAVAAFIPVGLLVLLPIEGFLNVSIASDTFAFVPLLRVSSLFSGGTIDMRILLGLGAMAVALLFVYLPQRVAALALPTGVAAFLALSSWPVIGFARTQALGAVFSQGVPPTNLSWVDDRVGTDEHVLFVNNINLSQNPHTLWQTEFWNRSVDTVLDVTDPYIMLGRPASIDTRTGLITTSDPIAAGPAKRARYAVAPTTLELAGKVVEQPGPLLALYRIELPLRLARVMSGLYGDGWTADKFVLTQYSTPGGSRRLVLRLTRPTLVKRGRVGPARAVVSVGTLRVAADGTHSLGRTTVHRSVRLPENRPVVLVLKVPPPPFRLELSVTPSFTPNDLGLGDTRVLGAQLRMSFGP